MQTPSPIEPADTQPDPRQRIRREIRLLRRRLSAGQQSLFAAQAAERAMELDRVRRAESVAVFLSFDGELDTRPLIEQLWAAGKRVYLPVLHPFSPGNLLFLRYAPETELVLNRFHILEPRLDVRQVLPAERLDVLFAPLVAFDSAGQRLGMGGGFYDRTLSGWRRRGPYPIGLAHDCQRVERLPAQEWDIPLPEVVTPSRRWWWTE